MAIGPALKWLLPKAMAFFPARCLPLAINQLFHWGESACPIGGNYRTGMVNCRAIPSCNIQISGRYILLFHYSIFKATGKKPNKLLVFQYITETRTHQTVGADRAM